MTRPLDAIADASDQYAWPVPLQHLRKPRRPRPVAAGRGEGLPPALSLRGGLEPYTEPLDRRRAAHLLRRTGFGAAPEALDALVGLPAAAAVDLLVDAALAEPLPPPPPWADAFLPPPSAPQAVFDQYAQDNLRWNDDYTAGWLQAMAEGGLRERLTLFWHDHFVTERDTYFFAPLAYRYLSLLRTHALGNFKTFVEAVGLNPAMLIYLNGDVNNVEEPNENYARELLELFTMGQVDARGNLNYTQHDIEEVARALTGWHVDYSRFATEFYGHFDAGEKEIFGRRGAYTYLGVIDLIFEERGFQVATFICRKLYALLVYATPDDAVVEALAGVFVAGGFELAPVVRTLLRSAHFFDEQVMGAQIKSPVDLLIGLIRETGVQERGQQLAPNTFNHLHWSANALEQALFDPPNVAGWPGYRSWISASTLAARWETTGSYLSHRLVGHFVSLVPLAERLIDPADPLAVFKLPVALAEHLVAVPAGALGYAAPQADFAGDLAGHPIPDAVRDGPAYVRDLAKLFLRGAPWYEWHFYHAGTLWLLFNYALFLTRLPEYQLR